MREWRDSATQLLLELRELLEGSPNTLLKLRRFKPQVGDNVSNANLCQNYTFMILLTYYALVMYTYFAS